MSKKKKKWIFAGKILLWIVVFFFFVVPSLLFFAIQTTTVQNYLIPMIEDSATKFLGTNVTIGSLEYKFLLSLQINEVTIEDLQQQKLLTIKHCLVDIDKLDVFLQILTVKEIVLTQPEFLLYQYKQRDSIFRNFDFLIKKFQQPDTTNSTKNIFFAIKLQDFAIQNLSVQWIDSIEDKTFLFDEINLKLRKISMQHNDALSFSLKNFSCKNILGLSIQRFSGNVFIHADSINIDNAQIEDGLSTLALSLSAHKKSSKVAKDLNLKDWNVVLRLPENNYFDSRSLHFLLPNIPQIVIHSLSGELKKSNDNITISQPLTFSINNNIHGRFSGNLNNVLDIKNLNSNIIIEYIKGKGVDLNTLLDSLRRQVKIPHEISFRNDLQFLVQGNYQLNLKNSELDNFSGSSHLSHSSGNYVSFYVMTKADSLYKKLLYTKAECVFYDFPLSLVTTQLPLDVSNAQINTRGTINTSDYKESQLSMTGLFDNVSFGDDKYNNIDIVGQLKNGQIEVSLASLDKHLKGKFTGYYHFLTERIQYDLDLQHIDLRHLFHADSTHQLSGKSYGNFTINTLDTVNGTFYITNIVYNNKVIDSLQFTLRSTKNISGIYLNSKSITAEITGKKHIAQAIPTIQYVAKRYLSYTAEKPEKHTFAVADSSNYYRFRFTLHRNKWLQTIIPSLHTEGETVIVGYLNTPESPFKCNIDIPSFTYNNYQFSNTTLEATLVDSLLLINIENDKIENNGKILLQKIQAKGDFRAGRLNSKITFIEALDNKKSLLSCRFFLPHSHYNKTPQYIIETETSHLYLSHREFKIHHNRIAFDSTQLKIDNFAITSNNFRLSGNGSYSNNKNDTLAFTFQNFDIGLLNNPSNETQIEGLLSGAMQISQITEKNNNITGEIHCQQFQLNEYQVGDILFKSTYLPFTNNISLSTQITRNDSLQAKIEGFITPDLSSIDAKATFQSFDLGILNPILKDILYITGFGTGNLSITGKPSSPSINGILYPSLASIRVEPTQCTYFIHEKGAQVVNSELIFDNFFAHDIRGNNFSVNTRLNHFFGDVTVKVDAVAQNVKGYDVNEVQSPNFYGSAFGSGTVNIKRLDKKTTVNITAQTEKGTHLIIPMLTSIDASSGSNSISFIATKDSPKEITLNNVKVPNDVQLNFNVDVTQDASIELLLNPLTQENIKGYGEGKLTVDYNGLRNNALRIFGEYRLTKGDYMFSYYKLVNKKFALNPGSKITFNGNLEDTRLDLVASYKARASLATLVGDTTTLLRRSTPIECNINITGNIYQPTLQVTITAPNADLEIQNKMRAALYDKDVVIMQFVSLLLTNQFIANNELANVLPSTSSGGNMAALFTGELIASQVNSVLSQILPLSVNLKLSPSIDGGKTDVGVSLTSDITDWLMLNGSIEYLQKSSIRNETVQGDLSLEAKIDKDGNLRVKAFTQANDNQSLYEFDNQGLNNRHGVGIFYQKEFNSFKELFESKSKKESKSEK